MDISLSITKTTVISELSESRDSHCQSFHHRSPNLETHRTRGELFALISTTSPDQELDLPFLSTQTFKTLTQEYFDHPGGSITQALQNSLEKTKEKAYLLTKKPKQAWDVVKLNLAVAVIWGDILYFGRLGEAQIALLSGEEVISFPFTNLGSEKIKNHDTVILCCPTFWEKVGRQTISNILVKNSPRSSENKAGWTDLFKEEMKKYKDTPAMGATFLNIQEEKVPSDEEIIDIGMITDTRKRPPLGTSLLIHVRYLIHQIKRFIPSAPKLVIKKPEFTSPRQRIIGTTALGVLLLGSILSTYLYRNYKQSQQQQNALIQQAQALLSQGQVASSQNPQEAGSYLQQAVQLLEQIPNDKQAQQLATEITNALNEAQRLTTLNPTIEQSWPDEARLRIYLKQENGISTFDQEKIVLETDTDWQDIVSIDSFDSGQGYNLYLLDRQAQQIHKYLALSGGQDYSKRFNYFTTTPDFSKAIDFSIDGAIYILYQTGEIYKFLGGEKQEFQLSGFYPELTNAQSIFTSPEINQLYVTKDHTIYIFDKDGKYQKGLVLATDQVIVNVYVDDEKKKLWFGEYESPYAILLP
ncbi:hypothetical protein KJ596_04020 [Patescibacteria group bacterium]|nr:hypothetical protein [Patescibacteria group bacterium]MBU1868337.1 hypothetical protein [Patescibacteria group bacterium]